MTDQELIATGMVTEKILSLARSKVLRPGEVNLDNSYVNAVMNAHDREMLAMLIVKTPGQSVSWPLSNPYMGRVY